MSNKPLKTNFRKTNVNGSFSFEIQNATLKGAFNVYQAKNGGIYLLMGNSKTLLSYEQIKDLNIPCYELKDFDIDALYLFYNK